MPRQPDPIGTFSAQIRALQDRVARLERSSPFSRSGIGITGADSFTLPNDSILNDYLANLTGWQAVTSVTQTGWSTSTSLASKASTTATVPSGFTSALIIGWGVVVFQDSGGAPNRFDIRITLEGSNSPTVTNLANTVNNTSILHSTSQTVTSGQTLNFDVSVLSAVANSPGSSANQAIIGGFVLYQR